MNKIKTIAIAVMASAGILIPATASHAAPQGVWTNNAARNTIIRIESSGNPNAVNPSSGARGLYQCLPAAHACPSLGDIKAQHKWGQAYVMSRYGTWEAALAFHNAHGWY